MFVRCRSCLRLLIKGQTCTCGTVSTGILSDKD